MKRILSFLVLAAVVGLVTAAAAQAAPHSSKRHSGPRMQAVAALPAAGDAASCPISGNCGGHCPLGSSSVKATAAVATPASMSGKACPVSDPSQCPSSCRRTSATAAMTVASR